MAKCNREEKIMKAVERIEQSALSAEEYIQRYGAPFSIAQFYRYRARLSKEGQEGLRDRRAKGNHRKLGRDEIAFLRGFIKDRAEVTPSRAQRVVAEEFGISVDLSTMSRVLRKLGVELVRSRREVVTKERVSCAGFELIAALAKHLGWPEHTARSVMDVIKERGLEPQPSGYHDKYGRNAKGQFTKRYNQRLSVRKMRFASIDKKRVRKDLGQMDIFETSMKSLERKALAILALPLVTLNGEVRHVNTAIGNRLAGFCGYNYKQATLDRFLRELKYLGVSEWLLGEQVRFWNEMWPKCESDLDLPFLCYYIDGNTKPIWSRQRVRQNKVTMLGRVMGCLEQVFVHDGFGRPIYFETYSGHGPMGVYTLAMMDKVEQYLEGVARDGQVSRVLVMDGASNSVATLRAFASQDRYHYITTLDDNQWSERKVRHEGIGERYRYGDGTLYDCEIELEDSKEKGYVLVARAVRVDWDYGKRTVLLTSLPASVVGPSLVVKGYFDRWPQQELMFRKMKGFASLHRVAGYGKQLVEDPTVQAKQQELQEKVQTLRDKLKAPLREIAQETATLTALIGQERTLRGQSRIEDGKRILGKEDEEALRLCTREIGRIHRRIKAIEKSHEKEFKNLHRYEVRWMRLQGKEVVYKVDVELDQILTYFRVSLANLCAYFLKEFLQMGPLSISTLMQSVLFLDGNIEETPNSRKVTLIRNPKDSLMMKKLEAALAKLNALALQTLSGKNYQFSLS
jgi:transposase